MSLPVCHEFARVGKLSFSGKVLRQRDLRREKKLVCQFARFFEGGRRSARHVCGRTAGTFPRLFPSWRILHDGNNLARPWPRLAGLSPPANRLGGLWRLLVADRAADRVGGHRARLHAKPCERTGRLQCRGMFLLPRCAQPARSIKAGRRTCHPLAIRHLLRSEYFARPRRRYRAMDRA